MINTSKVLLDEFGDGVQIGATVFHYMNVPCALFQEEKENTTLIIYLPLSTPEKVFKAGTIILRDYSTEGYSPSVRRVIHSNLRKKTGKGAKRGG